MSSPSFHQVGLRPFQYCSCEKAIISQQKVCRTIGIEYSIANMAFGGHTAFETLGIPGEGLLNASVDLGSQAQALEVDPSPLPRPPAPPGPRRLATLVWGSQSFAGGGPPSYPRTHEFIGSSLKVLV